MMSSTQAVRLDRTEKGLVLSGVLSAIICSILLLTDSWLSYDQTNQKGELAGTLADTSNDVRKKNKGHSLWLPASKQTPLYYGDYIYTGNESSSVVELKNQGQLLIGPNSLVFFNQLDEFDNKLSLKVQSGKIRLKSVKQKIEVKVKDKVISSETANTVVDLKVDEKGAASVSLIEGQAEVEFKGEKRKIEKEVETIITTDKVIEKPTMVTQKDEDFVEEKKEVEKLIPDLPKKEEAEVKKAELKPEVKEEVIEKPKKVTSKPETKTDRKPSQKKPKNQRKKINKPKNFNIDEFDAIRGIINP